MVVQASRMAVSNAGKGTEYKIRYQPLSTSWPCFPCVAFILQQIFPRDTGMARGSSRVPISVGTSPPSPKDNIALQKIPAKSPKFLPVGLGWITSPSLSSHCDCACLGQWLRKQDQLQLNHMDGERERESRGRRKGNGWCKDNNQ